MSPPILPSSLDYTDKDFASIRLRLQSLIQSVFPTWTDFNVANFGDILLELYAFVGDLLGFYQDNQARESRLSTATQIQNVIALAQMLGYAPATATAAQATLTVTRDPNLANTFTYPQGSIIQSANITLAVAFQTLEDTSFADSQATATVLVEHSQFQADNFSSNGLPNQTFVLSKTPFLATSGGSPCTQAFAGNGTYNPVDNFLNSNSTDTVFTVSVDQNGRATLTTGDGVNGAVPSGFFNVRYRTGGGSIGNVDPGTIVNVQGSFTDDFGNPLQLTATNPVRSSGGTDGQTVAQIKTSAPQTLQSNTRTVTDTDFVTNSERVTGVGRALISTSDTNPAVPENTGEIYIVPDDGGIADPSLLDGVIQMVTGTRPCLLTFKVNAFSAIYLPVNVFCRFYKQKNTTSAQAAANIRTTLKSLFSVLNPDGTKNTNIDFGANLTDTNGNPSPFISINALITACGPLTATGGTSGVREIGGNPFDFLLNNAHADVTLTSVQFPSLGTITLVDGDTGLQV